MGLSNKFPCHRCGRTAESGCAVGYWEAILRGDPEAPQLRYVATSRQDAQAALVGADIACRVHSAQRTDVATPTLASFINWCEVTDAAHEPDDSGACVECGLVV